MGYSRVGILQRIKSIFNRGASQRTQDTRTGPDTSTDTSKSLEVLDERFNQFIRFSEVLGENDRLRGEVLDLKTQLIEGKDSTTQEILHLKDQLYDLKVSEVEYQKEIMELKKGSYSSPGDDINPTREAVYWILQVRPKIRTKTIAEFLGVTDRTVRGYRSEFKRHTIEEGKK